MSDIFSWLRKQWGLVLLLSSVLILIILIIAGYIFDVEWIGVSSYTYSFGGETHFTRGKTLWDWLSLLIIPIFLAIGGWLIKITDQNREQRIIANRKTMELELAHDKQLQTTLETYLNEMSALLLNKDLGTTDETLAVQRVSRTRTLLVLQVLDGNRKGQVMRFLSESNLLVNKWLSLPESGDDRSLQSVDLDSADITEADLAGVNLDRVQLNNADLSDAQLSGAYLRGAKLNRTRLQRSVFHNARLENADLRAARLIGADLRWANLVRVKLDGAKLQGADLRWADLADVSWNQAEYDDSTQWPKGFSIPSQAIFHQMGNKGRAIAF